VWDAFSRGSGYIRSMLENSDAINDFHVSGDLVSSTGRLAT